MNRPFFLNLLPQMTVANSHNGLTAGTLGGVAPHTPTIGVRRDFSFTPQYIPSLTTTGGLKPPVRG